MLITRRNPIPTRWILMAVLPWGAIIFQNQVMGTAQRHGEEAVTCG